MPNSLTRFDPFGDLTRFEPFRGFEDFFRQLRHGSFAGMADGTPSVRMDVTETDAAYQVEAEMPGIKKEDLNVNIDGNTVSFSASNTQEREDKSGTNICRERSWGQYYRSFTLPQAVDDAQAKAEYHDGILSLTLPKKSGGAARRLQIG